MNFTFKITWSYVRCLSHHSFNGDFLSIQIFSSCPRTLLFLPSGDPRRITILIMIRFKVSIFSFFPLLPSSRGDKWLH